MTDIQQTTDPINWEVDKKKLPEMLNVLTILTFVGSGLGIISSIFGYFNAQKNFDKIADLQGKLDNAPEFAKKLAGPEMMEISRKSLENRLPILILAVIACAICIYATTQMRALKKVGFSIYLIGEIVLPVITTIVFLGSGAFSGLAVILSLLFPVVFIILYATQLKNLSAT